jgi:hypothetical protein
MKESKAAKVLWAISGFAGGAYAIICLSGLFFSDRLGPLAARAGHITLPGWCALLLFMTVTWLMLWRMLMQIHCRTGICITVPLVIALCMGLMGAWCLGLNIGIEALGIWNMAGVMILGLGSLLLVMCLGIAYRLSSSPRFPATIKTALFVPETQTEAAGGKSGDSDSEHK